MMSIPKVSEDHLPVLRHFRRYFIAQPGHVLVAADYSQVELRLLAHLSGDPRMTHAYTSGRDVHAETAMQLFGKAAANVTPEERQVR
jgi:DNA polymerase-1